MRWGRPFDHDAGESNALLGVYFSDTTMRGGQAFTITANCSNFVSASTIQWNGTAVSTTFASPSELTAQISADLISVAGTYNITVSTPSPGGGTSSSLPFDIPCVLAQPTAASAQTQARLGAYYFDGWARPLNSYHLKQLVNSLTRISSL
ncbi:MAG TPA: hypothetical protein VJQ54_19800 [Candidatus Sulfotelmatobacter sp.]|nr:hypothetical protein [Candidatus Sulfotelmatobacter sp.]